MIQCHEEVLAPTEIDLTVTLYIYIYNVVLQCFRKVHYTKQMCLFVLLDLLKPIVYSLIAPCGIGVPMSNPI